MSHAHEDITCPVCTCALRSFDEYRQHVALHTKQEISQVQIKLIRNMDPCLKMVTHMSMISVKNVGNA